MKTPRLSLAAICLLSSSLLAQQPTSVRQLTPKPRSETPPPPTPAAATRGVHDRAELEAFVDGIMDANLRDKHVAGATVAVVKDGALFFAKGYGYADVDKRKPVDAEHSLFRIGSTSKLFTWTAVMQLVRTGEARSRHRRQSLPRLQDPGDLPAADHAAAHHDPHARV